jgi:talin
MGIANYEEYSLINDVPESEKERTLKRDKATLPRDFKKLEVMKRKLHTDDDST